jgi:transposase
MILFVERDEKKREIFKRELLKKEACSVVYLDESGINHEEVKAYGWGLRKERLYGSKQGRHHSRTSIIAGICNGNVIGKAYFKGHTTTDIFCQWLKEVLVPRLNPGQTIILDNASFHKSKNVVEIVKSAKCEIIYLPPYSPDLNPIEHYWSFLKRKIREKYKSRQNFYKKLNRVLKLQYGTTLS